MPTYSTNPADYAGTADAFGVTAGRNLPPGNLNNSGVTKINQSTGYISFTQPEAIVNSSGPLKYPLVNPERYSGVISFQAYKVIPPTSDARLNVKDFVEGAKQVTTSLANQIVRDRNTSQIINSDPEGAGALANLQYSANDPEGAAAVASLSNERVKNTRNKAFNPLMMDPLPNEKCSLYLPLSYVVNDNMNYNTPDLGVLGGSIASAISGGASLPQSLQRGLGEAGRSFFDFFQNGAISSDLARLAAVRALNTIRISDTVKNAISLAGQVTVNPNTRALFDRVVLREFNFIFKFIPKSREESLQVRNIIKFFRKHAYPETIDPGGLPIGYRFPNLFKIGLKYDNQQVGTKIKLCYLRNISTNYNPGQASFYKGGDGSGHAAPVETDLSLTFIEHKTLSRADVLTGSNATGNTAIDGDGGY